MIEVRDLEGSALVQDLGRPGLSHLGVSPSGAADRGALIAANRRVGNDPGAAALEIMGAATLRVHADMLLALAGARADIALDGVATDARVVAVPAGTLVSLAAPRGGLRSYVAVAGGFDVDPVLGSRSTDVLSGLGPAPLATGDRLAVAAATGALPTVPDQPDAPDRPPSGALVMLDATPGPRAGWVTDVAELYERPWRVSALADRVGTRLEGEPLTRAVADELPSEGVVTGSVQVPPSGEPVILGPDHPVTGGYPVVAVLTERACDVLGQLRTGTTVRFRRAGEPGVVNET